MTAVLGAFDAVRRGPFEARAQDWAARARKETDERFACIWGLDLGTTSCAVAIYDSRIGRPVLCPWKGSTQFASTLSIDVDGVEQVGLFGEEILGERVGLQNPGAACKLL
ncbi:hypothetical protein, partial [Frankia sp. CiP3]|uniref:hypothetical protein n=1 Tax=Frankia sp. CiP3 TaxID=2880971 RepID=UPI001EF55653